MCINCSKSKCIRFGPRYKNTCDNISTRDGKIIEWLGACRYLGIFFISGPKLKTSNDNAKAQYYREFRSIIGKIGRCASSEVTVPLIKAKCLPILLYGTEACNFSVRVSCTLMKVLNTKSSDIFENYKLAFGFRPFARSVAIMKRHFYNKCATTDNELCQAITAFTLSSDYVANEAVIAKH